MPKLLFIQFFASRRDRPDSSTLPSRQFLGRLFGDFIGNIALLLLNMFRVDLLGGLHSISDVDHEAFFLSFYFTFAYF